MSCRDMMTDDDERWVQWFMATRWTAAPGSHGHNLLVHAWRSLSRADDGRVFRRLVMSSTDAERAEKLLALVRRRPHIRAVLSLVALPAGHKCSHCPQPKPPPITTVYL